MIKFLRNIVILLIVLLAILWVVFQSEAVRQKAAVKLEEVVYNATGMHIKMEKMAFTLPGTITAYNLEVRDKTNRLLLEADQAEFTIAVNPLFKGEMPNVAINVQHADLHALPEHTESNSNTSDITLSVRSLDISQKALDAFDLPSTFKLETLNLNNILFLTSTQELSGEAYIEGYLNGKPINLQATFQRKQGIKADFKAIYDAVLPVNGTFSLSPEGHLDGTTFQIPWTDISTLTKDYEGTVQIEGSLYGAASAPLIDLNVESPMLVSKEVQLQNLVARIIGTASEKEAAGQVNFSSLIDGKELSFSTDFRWLFGEMATVESSELIFDDLVLTHLAIEGSLQQLELYHFSVYGEGVLKEAPIEFQTKGVWQEVYSKLAIESFTMKMAENIATGSFTYSPEEINGTLELQNMALSSLPLQWADKPAKGSVSLKAHITGSPSDPRVRLSLAAHELEVEDESLKKINPCRCELNAAIENGLFSSKGLLTIPNLPSLQFQVQLPIAFSISPWMFDVNKEAPLAGHLAAEGELSQILQNLMDNPLAFSGNVKMLLNLAGTVQQPQCTGHLNIHRGIYEIPEIGVLLKDLHAAIEVQGRHLVIKEIAASDGKGGRVYGKGYYDIDEKLQNPFILELNLQEAALLNQDNIKIISNGPLTFKGNAKEGLLAGQLQVSDATATIPERSYSTINTVDVTYVNIPKEAQKPQCSIAKKTPWPLSLDIHLDIPRSMSIESKDLTSSWKGEVAVQGKASAPQLFGELRISEGQYLFNGNPFALNQGTISFAGEFEKKTTLYVIAEKDLDKVKVDVIVKGAVKNPEISFRSNPPMPQREILSWLLFNRGTSQISPFQGAQLSESITNLSAANQQGTDVLSKIRSTFKIDRFEIGRNPSIDNTGVNLEVGKYISDNILISVIKSDVNKIAIEANLTDRIKLQGQVGDDSQGKLLLKWKRDY